VPLQPVLLSNASLRRDPRWDIDFLHAELGARQCSVLSCPAASRVFTVFRSGSQHGAYEANGDVRVEEMAFHQFVRCLREQEAGHFEGGRMRYLQTHLMERLYAESGESCVAPRQLPEGVVRRVLTDASLHPPWLQQLRREGGLGEWCLSTLWISPGDACSRCHIDLHNNLLLQLEGRKRVVLLDPLEARHLYLHPISHPLDMRPRVCIKSPDLEQFPRFAEARGFETFLEAGECLFIPRMWFHEVDSLTTSASLNFWFESTWPSIVSDLPPSMDVMLQLARDTELALVDTLGACHIASFLQFALTADEESSGADECKYPARWTYLREELFEILLGWLGARERVEGFLFDFLHPHRFIGLHLKTAAKS